MTAKDYLGQIRVADLKIKQLEERLESLRYFGGAIRYDVPPVQHSPSNSLETRLVELVDLERDVLEEKFRLEQLRVRITREIHALDEPKYISLLYMRYVDGKRFEQIAAEMQYDYDWTRHLHRQALSAFADRYGLEEAEENDPRV